jgi:Spy/CpxP family protein refolding chaperone
MTDPRTELPSSARPDRSFSPRTMAAVVVGVTLLAGILVGIGLDRAVLRPPRFGPRFGQRWHGANADSARQQMRAEFSRQLHLTPDQAARIDTIMQRRMEVLDSIRKETGPQIRALVGATRAQIDSVLTPEQRDRFRSLQHRRSRRFQTDTGGRGP